MEGDLSLAQTLGGLRIANPDALQSPTSSKADSVIHSPLQPLASPLHARSDQAFKSPSISLSQHTNNMLRSPSPLGFNPEDFSMNSTTLSTAQVPVSPLITTQSSTAESSHHFTAKPPPSPLTEPNFPRQFDVAIPQSGLQTTQPPQHGFGVITSHPSSANHAQMSGSRTSINPLREGSYRSHEDPTQTSKLVSRAASTAHQAGVPINEGSHTERVYRSSQSYTPNNQLPPRRSSRNQGGGLTYQSSNSSTLRYKTQPQQVHGRNLGSHYGNEEWQDRGAAIGVQKETDANGQQVYRQVKKGVKDFAFGRTLGEGSYSTVMAATDRQTGREFAIKILDKRHIIKEKKVKYVNIEKDTLNRLIDHPGVVRLYYTFQDEQSLYFVLDLCSSGELLGVLKRTTTFDEECTRFYGAEMLDVIGYMHSKGVIHRDLKPENVLLDNHMHVKITDFGTAKLLDQRRKSTQPLGGSGSIGDSLERMDDNKANSFVGTAEYVSPELLTDKRACKASDLWAFGCIIYQLLVGRPPFKAGNEYLTFQKIVSLDYNFPAGFPEPAKDLVERLLVLDPSSRLSIEHIKNHEFFRGIEWGRGLWKQQAPRLKPFIPHAAKPRQLSGDDNSYPPNIVPSHSVSRKRIDTPPATILPRTSQRSAADIPPPSQLDLEWSPVLTHANERILKMGNLSVNSIANPHSPISRGGNFVGESETPSKFSRLFGGGKDHRKRQRLIMVTSSARLIMAAAGGDEKKSKSEINLLAPTAVTWSKSQDSKGFACWCINTADKQYTFEDPKIISSSAVGSASSACQEWLDVMDQARDIALSHRSLQPQPATKSTPDTQNTTQSNLAPIITTGRQFDLDAPPDASLRKASGTSHSNATSPHDPTTRHFRHKATQGQDRLAPLGTGIGPASSVNEESSFLSRKRFSKRQSSSGLAAVF